MEPIFAFFNYVWSRFHSSPVIETIGLDRNANGDIILPSSQHYRPCAINMFPVEAKAEDDQSCYQFQQGFHRIGKEDVINGGVFTINNRY